MNQKISQVHKRMASRIELWPTDRLRPYQNNPRTHSPEQVAQIASSIAEFGFNNPVLVDSADGIVAGHGRLLAAQQLGLDQIPVVVLDHLNDVQRRAYIIADNKLAEQAGWDEDLLTEELTMLRDEDFDLSVVGFTEEELTSLLDTEGVTEGLTDEDSVPELQQALVSKPGDLWFLGQHHLMCGDATNQENIETLLAGETVNLVFTDPPYGVDYRGSASDKEKGVTRSILNDDLGPGFEQFLLTVCQNLLTVTEGAVYVCMSSAALDVLKKAFTEAGGHWSTFIIWAKNHFTLGRSDYQRQYEPILYGWQEGNDHYWCGARDQSDVWLVDKSPSNELHPTMKPVELVERAILNSSCKGDRVLDPFAGSGSTVIACERTGRTAFTMDLDPKYVDVIIRRWQEFTGKSATLKWDGRPFDEIAAERQP